MEKIENEFAVLRADIPSTLHSRFKSKCALLGYRMNEVAQALVESWVETQNKGTGSERIVHEWMQRNGK